MTTQRSVPDEDVTSGRFATMPSFAAFVDFVLTRFEKWQPHGLCARPGRISDYSLNSLPSGTVQERADAAARLCRGCPVLMECGVLALATTAPDCIVSGVPYKGHPTERARLAETLGLSPEQLQYLRDR